jgi:hypothetical protein
VGCGVRVHDEFSNPDGYTHDELEEVNTPTHDGCTDAPTHDGYTDTRIRAGHRRCLGLDGVVHPSPLSLPPSLPSPPLPSLSPLAGSWV